VSLGPDLRERLKAIGTQPDGDLDAAEAALLLAAAARPGLDVEPYRRHLDRLAADVDAHAHRRAGEAGIALRAEALRQVLGRRYGYVADEEEGTDPADHDLAMTIDRRRGLSSGLAILYRAVARRLDWNLEAIDFPVRVLVRLDHGGRRVILDPADGGRERAVPDLRGLYKAVAGNQAEFKPADWKPLGDRDLLLRLQNHIRADLIRAGRHREALAAVEAAALVLPGRCELTREAGYLHARLDNLGAAIAALEDYLRRCSQDEGRHQVAVVLQDLRRKFMGE
jgi:regulator of sirC expression with transglutaminase-like and TPR domain